VMSGTVTTPPPRPSRSTFSTLMTVMGVRLQPRPARPTASACLGNFSMLAMLLNAFQVDLKPGDEPPFLDVRGFAKVDPTGAEQQQGYGVSSP
jgi:hypothetical protein